VTLIQGHTVKLNNLELR